MTERKQKFKKTKHKKTRLLSFRYRTTKVTMDGFPTLHVVYFSLRFTTHKDKGTTGSEKYLVLHTNLSILIHTVTTLYLK